MKFIEKIKFFFNPKKYVDYWIQMKVYKEVQDVVNNRRQLIINAETIR